MRYRLVAVATHPVQYQAPWFRSLASHPRIDLHVLYAARPDPVAQGIGFDRSFTWDLPLLDGYPSETLPNRRSRPTLDGFFRSSTPTVGARLRELAPDAVLVTGWQQWPLLQAVRAARALRIPTLVRGESNDLRPRRVAVRWLQRLLLRSFDAALTIGTANEEFYRRRGIPGERLFRCPYFVENERFVAQADAIAEQRAELRSGWGIDREATVFVFAGKLIPKKHPLDFLAAGAQAHRAGARLHLLVVGSGPLEARARTAAAATSVPVTFAGFLNQNEIARGYVAADALVLPSDAGETWGLVVNEAMACGRPALVSELAGCSPDLVVEGMTGHRFPCADVDRLAALMMSCAAAPDHLRVMGRHARDHVRSGYSVERSVDATFAAVESVVARKSRDRRGMRGRPLPAVERR